MSTREVADIIEGPELVWKGHFVLASGKHSGVYWEKFRILERPDLLEELCRPMVNNFANMPIDFIVGPSLGGMLVAYEVARQTKIRAAFAERRGSERFFRKPVLINEGSRVLIVDDVLMTGVTIDRVIAAVERIGALIVGIGIILDRSPQRPKFKYPLFSVHRMVIPDYVPEDCPLCKSGVPATDAAGTT